MTNFSVLVDVDGPRRDHYVESARRLLGEDITLRVGQQSAGPAAAIWSAGERAPVSTHRRECSFSVLLGHAYIPGSSARLDAAGLLAHWQTNDAHEPAPFDGFHAGIAFSTQFGLTVAADLLGLFPVYHATRDGVIVVASSPELISLHPMFPNRVDAQGLISILLLGCLASAQTLVTGIVRLGQGKALVCRPGVGPREVTQYVLPAERPQAQHMSADHIARLDDVIAAALRRQAPPGEPHGVLLSGGRDARLLAGYLARNGTPARALTFGQAHDYEARHARAAALALGMPHSVVSLDPAGSLPGAQRQAAREFVGTGFNNVSLWAANDVMGDFPPAWVGGHVFDAVITGATATPKDAELQRVLPILNRFGIETNQLRALVRDDGLQDVVDSGIDRIGLAYEQSSPVAELRPWRFQLGTSARFYAGGSYPWRLSLASWPVLPVLDRAVLDTVAELPISARLRRTAEDALLREKFPELARIPVVIRNAQVGLPLISSRGDRLRHHLRKVGRKLPAFRPRPERRYTYRLYDFNGPEWRGIRRTAEPFRERLEPWFRMDALGRFLPGPETDMSFDDAVIDAHGRKLLVGLMLWASRHLS